MHKEDFENLHIDLKKFLQENDESLDENYAFIKTYASAAVGSTDIIQTIASFYGNECFSNAAVLIKKDHNVWYEKVQHSS